MRCLLIYDIPDDRTRTRVSDACLDYGLERVQWSAFLGELNQTLQRELLLKVRTILGKKAAKNA
jgi:CRISPR-associated protein Cas2